MLAGIPEVQFGLDPRKTRDSRARIQFEWL